MIEVKTELNKSVQKELAKKHLIAAWILMGVGLVGCLIYIFGDLIFGETATWIEYFLISGIPLGFGIVLIIFINRNVKAIEKVNNVNFYSFDFDFVTINTVRNGENAGNVKVYYKDLIKVKETQSYIFMYINTVAAFPVLKENLTPLEQSEIKLLLNMNKLKQNNQIKEK